MPYACDYRGFLGRLILVIFLVVHAPISGVTNAAQAFGQTGPAGAGRMVICLDGQFTEVEAPAGAQHSEYAGHDCLCPCATLGGGNGLAGNASAAAAVFLQTELGPVGWSVHTRPVRAGAPQTGRGSPRSPPFFHI